MTSSRLGYASPAIAGAVLVMPDMHALLYSARYDHNE
jgi:hypothetical protein